ncbi:MAG: hypothetical protein IJ111_01135 [Eggerthellaceae bacterium]|nr:hypothetical protein [Eggerthellaceae bacterium]
MLSTRRKGVLAGAIVGVCAICIAVCAQAVTPPPHSIEPAQAIAVAKTNESDRSDGASSASSALEEAKSDYANATTEEIAAESREEKSDEFETVLTEEAVADTEADGSSRKQSMATSNDSSNRTVNEREKRWVVDYKQVWVDEPVVVEDVPGHYEDVIEYRDSLICLSPGCSFSTTSGDEMAAHSAQHAIRGQDDSSGSISQPCVVGSQWIEPVTHVDYNRTLVTVEDGGHWE